MHPCVCTLTGYMPVQSFASSLLNFTCLPLGDISIGLVSANNGCDECVLTHEKKKSPIRSLIHAMQFTRMDSAILFCQMLSRRLAHSRERMHSCCLIRTRPSGTTRMMCDPQVYLFGSVGALVGPAVIDRVGARRAMIATSLAFPIFAASLAYIVTPLVLTASILLGLCG